MLPGQQVAEQAVAPGEERRDQHREEDDGLSGLSHACEEPLGGGGHELEQADEIPLDPEQALLGPAGEREQQEREARRR